MSFTQLGITADRCFVVAEVAQAHDGSLGTAHAFIDVVADAGADAIKFQTHIARAESTLDEPWRVKFSRQDASRYAYWQRMEFSRDQWQELAAHCAERKLLFMSSPFSLEAVRLLEDLDMALWKIASGEIYNPELIAAVLATGRPVIYSSGMSSLGDLEPLVDQTRTNGNEFAILQCSTAYPCPPELWGLNVMDEISRVFDCPVGFSDHSGDIFAGLAAAALGARILELHVTLSRQAFGPDVVASVTPDELVRLVSGIRQINMSQAVAVSKQDIADQTGALKQVFGRSYALVEDLPGGTRLESRHLTLKKPAGGFGPDRAGELIGKVLAHDKPANRLLVAEDLL